MQINGNIGFGAMPVRQLVRKAEGFIAAATHPPVRAKAGSAANNAIKTGPKCGRPNAVANI